MKKLQLYILTNLIGCTDALLRYLMKRHLSVYMSDMKPVVLYTWESTSMQSLAKTLAESKPALH